MFGTRKPMFSLHVFGPAKFPSLPDAPEGSAGPYITADHPYTTCTIRRYRCPFCTARTPKRPTGKVRCSHQVRLISSGRFYIGRVARMESASPIGINGKMGSQHSIVVGLQG